MGLREKAAVRLKKFSAEQQIFQAFLTFIKLFVRKAKNPVREHGILHTHIFSFKR